MEYYSTAEPHPTEQCLPTLSKLGNPAIPDNIDARLIATNWLEVFERTTKSNNVDGVLDLLVQSSFLSDVLRTQVNEGSSPAKQEQDILSVFWRDCLALTWDFRTFEGTPSIREFLTSQLPKTKILNAKLDTKVPPSLEKPFPDLAWIQLVFSFETETGIASGVVRLVPLHADLAKSTPKVLTTGDLTWKATTVFTNLEGLKGFRESIGARRAAFPNHGKWEDQRRREVAFEDREPTVLVIGGGHNGLTLAARFKAVGLDALVVEKNERIGDNWRTRYEALCLHTTVWHDHMAYLPFPSSWPVYSPAKKMANWLEGYAEALELNVWTSSTVLDAIQDSATKLWHVRVRKPDGSERLFKVKNVVMAVGMRGGKANMPLYPGMDKFKGQILHSMQHKSALDHLGKRVVVIGSATSAHDISAEYVERGIDVTMVQRSSLYVLSNENGIPLMLGSVYSEHGHPTDVADRLSTAMPTAMLAGLLHRLVKIIAEKDRTLLENLQKVGFKLNMGYKDTGTLLDIWRRGTGFYVDVGASQYIIDGRIKLKNDSKVKELTENGVKFENGDEVPADVVLFCTGITDARDALRDIFGEEVTEGIPKIWGLDEEGEKMGILKEIGPDGLYVMMGDLSLCRFYSRHVALQIKAKEEGLFDKTLRYSV